MENLKRLPSGQQKPGCVVEVNPENKFKLCEENNIGKVDKIIVLKSFLCLLKLESDMLNLFAVLAQSTSDECKKLVFFCVFTYMVAKDFH